MDVVDELDEVEELVVEVLGNDSDATVVEVATTLVVEDVATGTEVEELLVDVTVVIDDEVVDASFGLGPSKAYAPSSCHCFPPKDPPPQTLRLQTIRLLALPTSK